MMEKQVNEPSAVVEDLAQDWPMLENVMSGTRAMRDAGTAHLPQWPNEQRASYAARLQTATLFPAYRRTVSVMAGKPFSKPLTLNDDVPPILRLWAENIDQQGVDLHSFAVEMFVRSLAYGLAGILIDYPDTLVRDAEGAPVPNQPTRTVAQTEALGIRPYWVRVRHDQILGWRTELRNGSIQLSQLRLLESVEEPDGPFASQSIPQVRLLTPGAWTTWRQLADKRTWAIHRTGTTTLTQIPFVPLYGRRDGFMLGRPPLLDLAYLNVKHWQSQSDQDTIEHVARVPILAMIGADDDAELTLGAQSAVKLPQGADLKFVEHSGAAISAGAASLVRLEDQMIQTGAELLVQKPGQRSATEAAGDAEANKCDLQRMAETFEDSLDQALQFTADFARLGSGGTVTLFRDYGAASLSEASAQLVIALQQGGLITRHTALSELKRRGMLEASIDPDTELASVDMEGPALGALSET